MKHIFFYTLLLSTIVLYAACYSPNSFETEQLRSADMSDVATNASFGGEESSSASALDVPADKKVIRTGSVAFESIDLGKSKEFILQLLKQKKAYIESEDANAGSDYSSISFTIRVPATDFDEFLSLLGSGNDKMVSKNIQTSDVTAHYVDVESRIKTKRIYLERYQNMVSTAKTTKELLEIEEQIRVIQEELDSYQSTFKVLNNQIAYSKLTISFSNQQDRISAGPSFWNQLKDAFMDSWSMLQTLFLELVRFLPVILIAILCVFIVKRLRTKGYFVRKNK